MEPKRILNNGVSNIITLKYSFSFLERQKCQHYYPSFLTEIDKIFDLIYAFRLLYVISATF